MKFKKGDKVTAPGVPLGYIEGINPTHYLVTPQGNSYREGDWHRKDLVYQLELQVGDKVRTIVGRVEWRDGDGIIGLRLAPGAQEIVIDEKSLELVERPKKEPKIGSVWQHCDNGETWVYIGSGRFYRANEPGIYTDRHNPDWAEVK